MKKILKIILIIVAVFILTTIATIIIFLNLIKQNTESTASNQGVELKDTRDLIQESKAGQKYYTMKTIHEEIMNYNLKYNRYPESFYDLDDYQKQENNKDETVSIERGYKDKSDDSIEVNSSESFKQGNYYDSFSYQKTKTGFKLCFNLETDYKSLQKGLNCVDQNFFKN